MDAQKQYHKTEELALEMTLENLEELLANCDSKTAFVRTLDTGFALGFEAAQLMMAEGYDLSKVSTKQTTLPV